MCIALSNRVRAGNNSITSGLLGRPSKNFFEESFLEGFEERQRKTFFIGAILFGEKKVFDIIGDFCFLFFFCTFNTAN